MLLHKPHEGFYFLRDFSLPYSLKFRSIIFSKMVIHRFNCDSFTRSPLPINIILLIIQTNIVQGVRQGDTDTIFLIKIKT
jgi:hypothetical protein